MTRFEKLFTAVRGGPVDRVPVSAWMHFGSEHLSQRHTALLHRKYLRSYDWDYLKVMSDYRFDVPGSLSFDCADSIKSLRAPTRSASCFAKQLDCVKRIQDACGHSVPIFDSGYVPTRCC